VEILGEPVAIEHSKITWGLPTELAKLALAPSDEAFLQWLLRRRSTLPMANSLDDELRAAAPAQVRRLRDLYGGRIPRAALMDGIWLRGHRIPIWNYQNGIFKPAILGRDGAALLRLPTLAKDQPAGEFLIWHNENVYLG